MTWREHWGRHAAWLEQLAAEKGWPIPALAHRPAIPPDLLPVAHAFDFLHLSRPAGFSVGAIPLVEIRAYASIYPTGLPLGDFAELIRLIDAEYLKTTHATHDQQETHPDTRPRDRSPRS